MNFYFYDVETGKELADHPLNGCRYGYVGGLVTVNGKDMCLDHGAKIWKDKNGRPARLYLESAGCRSITAEDFNGKTVLVKHWYACGDTEWFYLIPIKNKRNPNGD